MEEMHVPEFFETLIGEKLLEAMDDLPENYGACVDTQIEDICHTGYNGFIPFTNGGFDLTVPTDLRSIESSGDFPSNIKIKSKLEKVMDACYADSLRDFCNDNKEKLAELFTPEQLEDPKQDIINYHILYEMNQGQLAEELSEYESEYMSAGGTFFYQLRAMYFKADNCRNVSGKDEIYFLAGVNLDFEYGRDEGLEITYEKNISVEDLTIKQIETTIKEMVASI